MKINYKTFINLFVVTTLFITSSLRAQQRKDICPEPKIKKAYIENLQQWRNNNTLHTPSYINQVRVFFHIVTNDNGSHPGATEEQVMDALATMKTNFSAGNICFIFAGLNYVADAGLNHINVISNSNAEAEFAAHAIPGCLNIFYLDTIKGENSNSGGNISGLAFNTRPVRYVSLESGLLVAILLHMK